MGILNWLLGGGRRDGSSPARAVVVGSVEEEYAWIHRHCAECQLQRQSLVEVEGRPYDLHVLRDPGGGEREVYFDISRFFPPA